MVAFRARPSRTSLCHGLSFGSSAVRAAGSNEGGAVIHLHPLRTTRYGAPFPASRQYRDAGLLASLLSWKNLHLIEPTSDVPCHRTGTRRSHPFVRERARRAATFESHHSAVDLLGLGNARAFGLGTTRCALGTPSVVSRTVRASPHRGRNELGLSSERPATLIVRPSPRLASTSTEMSVTRGPRCR